MVPISGGSSVQVTHAYFKVDDLVNVSKCLKQIKLPILLNTLASHIEIQCYKIAIVLRTKKFNFLVFLLPRWPSVAASEYQGVGPSRK